MLSLQLYLLILGTAFVLMLVMLALFAWALVSLARAVLKGGPAPRHPLPSVALPSPSEPEKEAPARKSWVDNLDPWEPGLDPMLVNPATGLMMIGGIAGRDVLGNRWGCAWSDD